MDTHDEAAAADFEQGWSGERIAAARRAWGPAVASHSTASGASATGIGPGYSDARAATPASVEHR
ncbi:hypothetical protein [Cutibacterium granulosum]|uniref:hypothetical protein n=1 Tax=Cutibacterium granulosum TaxID=33011 RepID=UPI002B227A7E|nr:hypothetical protein [Cutibacterium granulosum]MEA5650951.1 hypothetical protein [Cutibacterium granulosum]